MEASADQTIMVANYWSFFSNGQEQHKHSVSFVHLISIKFILVGEGCNHQLIHQQSSCHFTFAPKCSPKAVKVGQLNRERKELQGLLVTELLTPYILINTPIQVLLQQCRGWGNHTSYNNPGGKKQRLLSGKHKPFLMLFFHIDLRFYNNSDCTMISMSDVQLGCPRFFSSTITFFNTLV